MSHNVQRAAARAALLCASLLCAARGVVGIRSSGIANAGASEPHAAAARLAAAHVALSAPLAAMVEAFGALLDSCGGGADDGALPTSAAAVDAPGILMDRLAADVAEIDAALRRCHVAVDGAADVDSENDHDAAGTRDRVMRPGVAHTAAASATLRQRLRDVERDAEALRQRARACKSQQNNNASPPPAGAAALYGWVRGARQALEAAPGCMLPEPAAACDCSRAVAAAVAATFSATAAAAAAVAAALLRSRQPAVGAPRRRLRGAAVLGLAHAANATPKQQHAVEP